MKGYFGIGVEGISKATNVGTLLRTAHAFGAAFVFGGVGRFLGARFSGALRRLQIPIASGG